MLALAITLGSIASYFGIGFAWSRKMLPVWWDKAAENYDNYMVGYGYGRSPYDSTYVRSSAKAQYFWKAIVWPFALPIYFISEGMDSAVDKSNPLTIEREMREKKRELQERERKIKKLESEALNNDDLDQKIHEAFVKFQKESIAK